MTASTSSTGPNHRAEGAAAQSPVPASPRPLPRRPPAPSQPALALSADGLEEARSYRRSWSSADATQSISAISTRPTVGVPLAPLTPVGLVTNDSAEGDREPDEEEWDRAVQDSGSRLSNRRLRRATGWCRTRGRLRRPGATARVIIVRTLDCEVRGNARAVYARADQRHPRRHPWAAESRRSRFQAVRLARPVFRGRQTWI